MSGVAVIRYLLVNNATLIAAVGVGPPTADKRIIVGEMPLATVLPAISVVQISSVPRLIVSMNQTKTQYTDRVQVNVLVKTPLGNPPGGGYPSLHGILKLVLAACPHVRGIINGIDVDSVLPDFEGPDLSDDVTAILSNSRDFFVKYNS